MKHANITKLVNKNCEESLVVQVRRLMLAIQMKNNCFLSIFEKILFL